MNHLCIPSKPKKGRKPPNSFSQARPLNPFRRAIRQRGAGGWSRPSIINVSSAMGKEQEGCETPSELSTVLNHDTSQLVSQENELESDLLGGTTLPGDGTSDSDCLSSGGAARSVTQTVSFAVNEPKISQNQNCEELQDTIKACVMETIKSFFASGLLPVNASPPPNTPPPTPHFVNPPLGTTPRCAASTQSGLLDFLTPGNQREMNCRDPYNTQNSPCDVPKPRSRQFTIVNDLATLDRTRPESPEPTSPLEGQRTKVSLIDKLATLPDYSGNGKADTDMFLGRFRNNCYGYKISHHDRTRYMALAFKGRVAQWFVQHMNKPLESRYYKDNDSLIVALYHFFGGGNANTVAYNAFKNFTVIKKETVIETIARFDNILVDMGHEQEETLKIQQFRSGLTQMIRYEMDALAGLRDKPTDLDQCRTLALQAEADLLVKAQEAANDRNQTTNASLVINAISDKQEPIRGQDCRCATVHEGPCLPCARCNRKGHQASDCHVPDGRLNLLCDKCGIRGHLLESCLVGLGNKRAWEKIKMLQVLRRNQRQEVRKEARIKKIITAATNESQQDQEIDDANADTSYELRNMHTLQIYTMQSEESIILELTMRAHGGRAFMVKALIDSGASGNFMDEEFAKLALLAMTKLNYSIRLTLADGKQSTAGFINHEVRNLHLTYGHHNEVISFLITKTPGTSVILGMPWLKKHNPCIDWIEQTVRFGGSGRVNELPGRGINNCM